MQQPIIVNLKYDRNCRLEGLRPLREAGFFVVVTDSKRDCGLEVALVCNDGAAEIELLQQLPRSWHDVPFQVDPDAVMRQLASGEAHWEDVGVKIASELLSATGTVRFGTDTQLGELSLTAELTAPGYEGRALVPFSEWADLFPAPKK